MLNELSRILVWPENFITYFCLIFTLVKGYGFKNRGKFTTVSSVLLFLILFALPMDLLPILHDSFYSYLIMLVFYGFLYAFLFVDHSIYTVMTTLISCFVTLTLSKAMLASMLRYFFAPILQGYAINIAFSLLYYLSLILLSFFYIKNTIKARYVTNIKYWLSMQIEPLLIYVSIHIIIKFSLNFRTRYPIFELYAFLFHFLMLIVLLILYYRSHLITRSYDKIVEMELIRQQQGLQIEHLERSVNMIDQIRRDKHEMKNLFFYLQSQLLMKNYNELEQFVEHNLGKRYERLEEFNTGNQFLDYLLTQKMNEARDSQIKVVSDVVLPAKLPIDNTDLCSLVMNLMDNAIEASKNETDGDIQVRIHIEKNYLCISISNKSSFDILQDNPELQTTKGDPFNHGIGIRIVKSIVDKYNGIFKNYMQSGRYVVDIMLALPYHS